MRDITETVPEHYFLVNDTKAVKFQEEFDSATSFAGITDLHLLSNMCNFIHRQEIPDKLEIGIKAGFQKPNSTVGFSARHILRRGHVANCLDLIRYTNLALKEIGSLEYDHPRLALVWSEANRAYVFVAKAKILPEREEFILLTLYPSGKNQLLIGTLYLVDENKFNYIRQSRERYRPVIIKQHLQLIETPKVEGAIEESSGSEVSVNNNTSRPNVNKSVSKKKSKDTSNSSYVDFCKKLQNIDFFDEGVTYYDLIERGLLTYDASLFELIKQDRKVNDEKRISILKTQTKFYRTITSEITQQLNMLKSINANSDRFHKKIRLVSKLVSEEKTLSHKQLDPLFKKEINHTDFESFFKQHFDSYAKYLEESKKTNQKIENNSGIEEILALPMHLADMPVSSNNNRKELEDDRVLHQSSLAEFMGNNINLSSKLQTLQVVSSEVQSQLLLLGSEDKLLETVKNEYSSIYHEKSEKTKELIAELEKVGPKIYEIYKDVVHFANCFIKYALKNDLHSIEQYNGFHLAKNLAKRSKAGKEYCENAHNPQQWEYFEKNFPKFLEKYATEVTAKNVPGPL